MNCTSPFLAIRYAKLSNGKNWMKILPKTINYKQACYRYGQESLMFLPCGKCSACLARRTKEWAVRCCMEAMIWKENCFLTLTYEKKVSTGKQVKEDLQSFIKAIRNKGYKVRYYGCVERGDQYGRLHAHLILFNFFPKDAKPWAKSQSGFQQYTSKIVSEAWNHGLAVCSEFHPFNAQYVAGYVVKKIMSQDDDSCHIQSTRPGLGFAYFIKHIQDVYDTDNLVLNFGSHVFSVPRYFDKIAESLCMDLDDVKAKRLEKGQMLTAQSMRDLGIDDLDWFNYRNDEVAKANTHRKRRQF